MDKAEIYEWLKSQKYQTGYDEVGEYVMYYSVDMPRILEDYYEYKVKKLNKPAVSVVREPVASGAVCPHFGTCQNGGKNEYCDLQTFNEIDCFVGQTER